MILPFLSRTVTVTQESNPAASYSTCFVWPGRSEWVFSTIVVLGEEDTLIPAGDAVALQSAIDGASLVLVPGAGHLPNLERPDIFNAVLLAFLAGVAGGTLPNPEPRAPSPGPRVPSPESRG